MSRFFGEIRQLGYVVPDIEAAMDYWTRTLGVGPFFYNPKVPIKNYQYKGQSYELTVPVPDGAIDARMATHLERAFAEEHERTYGHRAGPDEPVELVAIQLVGSGLREGSGVPQSVSPSRRNGAGPKSRKAYFGDHGWLDTPVLSRADLVNGRAGPLIIEEYDSTCVVPPGAHAECDAAGNIVITL